MRPSWANLFERDLGNGSMSRLFPEQSRHSDL